jgi:peroxiredoxin Q/BCP
MSDDRALSPGDAAPDFTLPAADGRLVSLSDYRGRRVVLYFYPKAMTSGCTIEACDFRDVSADFARFGVDVIGISRDGRDLLMQFRDEHGLTFPLLSDPDHAVHAAYGAWGLKMVDGQPTPGVIRSTIVVGVDGVIDHAFYAVTPAGHVADVQRALDG